jgi:hypothetical protein
MVVVTARFYFCDGLFPGRGGESVKLFTVPPLELAVFISRKSSPGIARAEEGESVHPGTDSSQRIQR